MRERKTIGDKISSLLCLTKRKSSNSSSEALLINKDDENLQILDSTTDKRKPGWKAMPYILANESIEETATYGLTTNFMVYLVREYHMDQVSAANILNIWICGCSLLTVVGASVADIYLGRFLTIASASFATLLGMMTITSTAFVPQLRPPPCITEVNTQTQQCASITKPQLGFLLLGLSLLGIGTGGIRPCSIPFGFDQFDSTTLEGRKAANSYLNLYYTILTFAMLINQTLIIYIQDSVSWALGFGIPTLLMLCAIPLFFFGSKIYYHVKPEGSTFVSFAQVLVAAYKKRHLKLHNDDRVQGVFVDVSSTGNVMLSKLPLTSHYSFLKKAALVLDNELKEDGSCANPWRLCSIRQVEDVICVTNILPMWASGGIYFVANAQEGTFMVSQAMKMDRHIGPNFQMPAGSIKFMSLITLIICLPLYDRVLQPTLRKITKREDGIPAIHRIGIGYLLAIMFLVVAGVVEQKRRSLAMSQGLEMSVFWLFPALMLLGMCQLFAMLGHLEFYNKEFPDHMKSIGNSLVYLCVAGATYLSSVVVSTVHSVTGKNGQPNWLDNDINVGRLDYYYFLIAALGVINFVYFCTCSRGYTYRASPKALENVGTHPIDHHLV